MKVSKKDGSEERRILVGMIVSKQVLATVSASWHKEMFESKWCNLIGGWCVKYYRKFRKAPRKAIQSVYETWSEHNTRAESDVAEAVENFLESLSDEYKELVTGINPNYIIDLAGRHFNRNKLKKLGETILAHLENDAGDKAMVDIAKFNKVEMGTGSGTQPFGDVSLIRNAFTQRSDVLVKYPGALGRFFGNALERDGFISFEGPEKGLKSYWLMDLAYRGVNQRRRVAFFQVGDLSEPQIILRLMSRVAREPLEACTIKYPIGIKKAKGGTIVKSEEREFVKPLNWRAAWKACQKASGKFDVSNFRLSCCPSDSMTVEGIQSQLEVWEHSNWVPDVVVVDYADILAPPIGVKDTLEQVDKNWSQLRALSQQWHCLVVTATQITREGYKAKVLSREHTAQNKRKIAHVTGMIGINRTSVDEEQDTCRLNWVVRRNARANSRWMVHVAGSVDIANPAIKSTL